MSEGMIAKTATVGVVILDFNQSEVTKRCLLSLVRGSRIPDIVVLIENGSKPLCDWHKGIPGTFNLVTLRPGKNLGCAGGRNLGLNYLMKNSNVTSFVVLDNDTVIPHNFIEGVVTLNLKPLDVAAPVVLDLRTNVIWSCGGTISSDGSIKQLTWQKDANHQKYTIVDWAPGACLIMSRKTWLVVGEFDEWMNFLFEDIEWCLRLRNAGGRVILRNDLQVLHEAHQSLGGRWSQTRVRLWARNGTLFRLITIQTGPFKAAKWIKGEILLAARDLASGRASWTMARLIGLVEGVSESIRRRVRLGWEMHGKVLCCKRHDRTQK